MATDIYPAIRAEVEALIDAYKTADMDAPVYSPQKRAAARAALNRRFEALMVEAIKSAESHMETNSENRHSFNRFVIARALLNEEPTPTKSLARPRRRRCELCQRLTHNWERVNGVTRCWSCGRAARKLEDTVQPLSSLPKQERQGG